MKWVRLVLVVMALLMLSASASASETLYQLGSVLSGFPAMAANNNPVAINNNIFHAFPEPQPGSGSISVSPMTFDNRISSSRPLTSSVFSGFTGRERYSPINLFSSSFADNNIGINTPTTDMSSVSSNTPMTMKTTDLYTAASPAEEYVYIDSPQGSGTTTARHPTGMALKALNIISTTNLYKEYTKYPHTPWRYLDLSGSGYSSGTIDMTTEIEPKFPSGPSTVNDWYNPDAPASGELFFCIDLNTGKILSQSFTDYRNSL